MLPVELIDKILFEHKNDEALTQTLERLKTKQPKGEKWAEQLQELGLFEIYGRPDYIQLTPFGNAIKTKGGWNKNKESDVDIYVKILLYLNEKKHTNEFRDLYELAQTEDEKKIIKAKAQELHNPPKGLIDFGPSNLNMSFSNSPSNYPPAQKTLNAKINLAGVEYVRALLAGAHPPINFIDQSTIQQITGSVIHGQVSQSSDSSVNKSIKPGSTNKKNTLKTVSIVIGIILAIISVVYYLMQLIS